MPRPPLPNGAFRLPIMVVAVAVVVESYRCCRSLVCLYFGGMPIIRWNIDGNSGKILQLDLLAVGEFGMLRKPIDRPSALPNSHVKARDCGTWQ